MNDIDNFIPLSQSRVNWVLSFIDYELKTRYKENKKCVVFNDEEINLMLNSLTANINK